MVSNPIQPRDGIVTPKLTELWSVGGEDDAQGDLINRPFEIRLAADGTVYVLDWGDVCIRVFDANGKLLRQVGRKGQGPGEFDTPFYFDVDGAGPHPCRRYAQPAGDPVRSGRQVRSPASGWRRSPAGIRVDARGRVFCGENSTGEPELTSEFRIVQRMLTIVRYDADGRNPPGTGRSGRKRC